MQIKTKSKMTLFTKSHYKAKYVNIVMIAVFYQSLLLIQDLYCNTVNSSTELPNA